jgi:dTDP-glucose 4,6-dehydratase
MGGEKLRLDGGGASRRVFIHIVDVADATLKIARSGRLGEAYHISGYELVSIRALVELILQRLGKSFDDCVEIVPERPGKDTTYMLDSSRLRTELGWRDTVSLERGVDDVIRWVERFGRDLARLPATYQHKP